MSMILTVGRWHLDAAFARLLPEIVIPGRGPSSASPESIATVKEYKFRTSHFVALRNDILRLPYFELGMAMRRPTPSGTASFTCAAFIRSSRAAMKSGNGAVLRAAMSTCSAMFSDVADSQPSSA
jgi:hypothetical protein